MEQNNKSKHTLKKFLVGLLDVLGEIVLFLICFGAGFGFFYLLGGSELADRATESEFIVLIGIAVIAFIVLIGCALAYCTKRIIRFLIKKLKK
ncbi:MAG: hypothetical protein IJX76_07380 [Clostridia bacterium]|nr:hypothetical protein [Clostridia bacterium]